MPPASNVSTGSLRVPRTARYASLGSPDAAEWWVVCHGYAQLASDFIRFVRPVATDDRFVLAPEALSRFYSDGMTEHRRVGASWMTREAREDEIADYVRYLDALVDHVRPGDATPSIRVLGFSQGAATASRWAMLGDTSVDRLVLWAGDLAHDLDLDVHAATLRTMDLTFVVGSDDEYIPPNRVQALQNRCTDHDVPVTLHTFDGGHRIDRDTLTTVVDGGGRQGG